MGRVWWHPPLIPAVVYMEVNLVCVASSRTVETTQTLSQNRNRNKKHKRLGKISKSKCIFVFFERKCSHLLLACVLILSQQW